MSSLAPVQYRTNLAGFKRNPAPPKFAMPDGACDSHMHIVGPFSKYPLRETRSMQPTEGTLDDYRQTMKLVGIQRAVVVQPSWYARDHECTLDAAAALGANGRAVVVVAPDVDESTLAALHARGARGVRLQNQVAGGTSVASLLEIAARIAPFGWHIQLFLDAPDIVDLAAVVRQSPVDVVFDHMAHLRREGSTDSAGFKALCGLMESGKAWCKLSNTRFFPDADRARKLIAANPQRVLWGSDWPSVAYEEELPGEGVLLDALDEWAGSEASRNAILVDNPGKLYFNDK